MGEHDVKLHKRRAGPAYDEDWAAWLTTQVELLKGRRFEDLDIDNLLDEVESLGKSNFRAFVSAIEVVLIHMLKWDYQPAFQSKSWARSIDGHRNQIREELDDNPSYKSRLDEAVERAYRAARFSAERETGLLLKTFPETCPYEWSAVLERKQRFTPD